MLRLLTAPSALWAATLTIVLTGLVAVVQAANGEWTPAALWQARAPLVQQIETAYLVAAPWLVMQVSAGWVERLRIIVDAHGAVFNRLKARIAGAGPLRAWMLVAWAVAAISITRLITPQVNEFSGERVLSGVAQLPLEIAVGVISLWRMSWLSRLAALPLKLNLFNPAPTYPFGWLSFAYAALLSLRIALRYLLVGSAHPMMQTAFGAFAIASLLMLVLPILGVFVQNTREKTAALSRIDAEVRGLTQPLTAPVLELPNVVQVNQQVDAWLALRKRVDAAWSWPVPDGGTAIRAVGVSLTPVLLPALKQYALPLVQQLLGI